MLAYIIDLQSPSRSNESDNSELEAPGFSTHHFYRNTIQLESQAWTGLQQINLCTLYTSNNGLLSHIQTV